MKYPEHRYLSMIITWITLTNLIEIRQGNVEKVMRKAVADGWICTIIEDGKEIIRVTDKGREQATWLLDQTDPKAAIQ